MDVQELLAREAIRDLARRYCRAVDRRDYAQLYALYDDDAIDEHGGMFCGSATDFIAWLPEGMSAVRRCSHQVLNHLVCVDGNYAEGEVYSLAYHLLEDEQGNAIDMLVGGRYLDHYCCRDGRWRFARRKIVMDWNRIGPSQAQWDAPMLEGTAVGGQTESDPSWHYFKLLK